MLHYIKLYFLLQSANIRSRYMYKFNFFMGISGVAFVGIGHFVMIWVLTERVPIIAGWNFYQMVFLAASFQLCLGIFIITFQQIRQIEQFIRAGDFDRFLVRPLNPLFQYFTFRMTIVGFGDMISGLIGITYVFFHTELDVKSIPLLILMVLSGSAIMWSLYTIIGSTAFWTLQAEGLREILNIFLFQFNQFPITVYNKVIQTILTYVLAIGFINYYPAALMFGKSDTVPFSPILVFAPPLVALLMVIIAYLVWTRGINAYKGAGS